MTVIWTRSARGKGAAGVPSATVSSAKLLSATLLSATVLSQTLLSATVAVGALGCSGESTLPNVNSRGGISNADADEDDDQNDVENNGADDLDEEQQPGAEAPVPAPGIDNVAYPAGPYGSTTGATLENLEFYGWRSPTGVSFDLARAETIRLSDYYNPQAAADGVEYILLNVVATWCSACRKEYTEMSANQVYAALAPRGLEIVGVLYQDNNSDPSRLVDMSNWAQAFSVAFPFVNDPGFKTGRYFDRAATPMNMVIDARTMQIVEVRTGYLPSMFDDIAARLQERGR